VKQLVSSLTLILTIQCGIIAAVYWPQINPENTATPHQLTQADPDQVDEIHINDDQDNLTILLRTADGWILPNEGDLPADASRVQELLAGLSPQRNLTPVAQTAAARQRFQVASYHYQRRVVIFAKGQLMDTVYLGTAPGYRKIHARNDGAEQIYSINFNGYDAPAESTAWLDRSLLQQRVPLNISSDLYDLRREGDQWLSGWDTAPDEREMEALLGALSNLQVEGIAEQDMQRDLATAEPDLGLTINSLSGQQSLELYSIQGQHFVYSSRYRLFFSISAYDYDKLTSINAQRLMSP
jgi:Domain of unknown function (DUF4340)